MNQLIKSLPTILRAAGDSEEVAEAAAIAAWKHAAGDGLHSMRGQLMFRVNTILGQPLVSAIAFVVDPKLALAQAEQQKREEEPLDNEVPLELWSAANAIHVKELRKSFLKTATLLLKRRASEE